MNSWKVTAIIFIILFTLESLFLIYAWNIGTKAIEREYECGINICADYQSYWYDDVTLMCYCYDKGEIAKQEYLS